MTLVVEVSASQPGGLEFKSQERQAWVHAPLITGLGAFNGMSDPK